MTQQADPLKDKTLEQSIDRVLARWEEMCDTCTDTPENLRSELLLLARDVARQARRKAAKAWELELRKIQAEEYVLIQIDEILCHLGRKG